MLKTSGKFFAICAMVLFVGMNSVVVPQALAQGKDVTGDMNIPDVVGMVNDVELPSTYVKFRLNLEIANMGKTPDLKQRTRMAKDIIEKEVVRELIYQEGKGQADLLVSQEALNEQMQQLRKNYKTEEEFAQALKDRGVTEADLKKTMEVDLMAQKLMDREVRGKINIKEDQAENFYKGNKERFHRPESYKAQHIFIPFVPFDVIKSTPREEIEKQAEDYTKKAEKKINEVHEQIKNGGNFEELAKKHSQDPASASRGGDLGAIYKGVFDPEFDEAVAKMKAGDVSGVVRTRFGFHIIKLNEVVPSDYAPFKEVKAEIQKFLFMGEAQKVVEKYIDVLRKKSKVKVFY